MKKENKGVSKLDLNKIKNTLKDIGNFILSIIKRIVKILSKLFKELSKIKIGKVNGVHIVSAIIVIILLILFVGGRDKEIAYPVIYNNSDGDLYLIDNTIKTEDDAIKLGNSENTSNIVYANTTDRYVLFQKNESLYLYDAKEKDETTKIVSDIEEYYFTEDDKYVVALTDSDELIVYDYKKSERIEKDVANIVEMSKDKILYEKEKVLYVRSINPKKDDRLKVTEEYDTFVHFSEDGKNIIYINTDKELHIFNINKDKDEKIAKNVSSCYCDDKSCERLFYVESDNTKTIYYYDGKNTKSMIKDIYSVNAYDVSRKQLIFTKYKDSKYEIYYQKVGSDPVLIEDELTGFRTVKLFEGKDIYYITSENEVRYIKIKGAKLGELKTIGEDVTGYLYLYKEGYAFVANVKNTKGTLYLAKGGKVKEIDEDVNSSLITVSNKGNAIYYLKDYKTTGDLYVTKGGKGKEIEKDVYNYEYVKDDLIYLIKDYSISKSRGDLYRYTNKSTLIAEDITRIASVPTYFELK